MQRVSTADRRARLVRRHHLSPQYPASNATALADRLVGLHATDPATVFLSARARVPELEAADLEAALYDDGMLVKHLGMRRTLFVLPATLVPVVQAACTNAIVAAQRRRLAKEIEQAGVAASGSRWLARAERATLEALRSFEGATGAQLSRAVPELQAKLVYGEGKKWGGAVGVAGRVLTVLEAEGRIVRGRPSGSWTSSRHRWLTAPEPLVTVSEPAARAELVRRWLASFGPGTLDDLAWWTGLGVGKIRASLSEVGAIGVDLDGEPGVILPDDLEPVAECEPAAMLLPSLDSTPMGWKRRDWYLGGYEDALFDRSGNVGPTVWWHGRVVGGWAQRENGDIAFRLLDDVGSDGLEAVAAEAGRLQQWLGETRLKPRFATPLETRLRSWP